MEFKVRFITAPESRNPIYLPAKYLGLEDVDALREFLGVQLAIERITSWVDALSSSVSFKLTEEQARESGYYKMSCETLEVMVEGESLNRYVTISPETDQDSQTGEYIKAGMKRQVDTLAVFNAWKAAGYPLTWVGETDNDTTDNP
jgi:hypothetical protein